MLVGKSRCWKRVVFSDRLGFLGNRRGQIRQVAVSCAPKTGWPGQRGFPTGRCFSPTLGNGSFDHERGF